MIMMYHCWHIDCQKVWLIAVFYNSALGIWWLLHKLHMHTAFLGWFFWVDLIKWVSNVRLYVHSFTKRFFDFNENWHVGRGRWVMHDGMQCDPIQGQGHKPLKVGNPSIFKSYLLPRFTMGAGNWPLILKLGHNI